MVRYFLINWESNPSLKMRSSYSEGDIIFFEDKSIEGSDFFICEKCFRLFKMRNINHLDKCEISWPYNSKLCAKYSRYPTQMVYRIEDEKDLLNKKIVRIVSRLGEFSKIEQGIDAPIIVNGLLKNRPFWFPFWSKHILYVLFSYKNIQAYCLVQEYPARIFEKEKSIVIRDVYTIQPSRKKGYASHILKIIGNDYQKRVDDFWFSRPVSESLKHLLKSMGFKDVRTIQGENHHSRQIEKL